MTNLEWLLKGDPVLVHLTKKYLLDEPSCSTNEGYISKYLSLYDEEKKTWGNGYYGPKWTSTHYTLMSLKQMEITPSQHIYQESLLNYVDHFFSKYIINKSIELMDLCIAGMMINMLSYAKLDVQRLYEMIDYVLKHLMSDGAWNCLWNHTSKPKISSVHTTINVLEGLIEYVNNAYTYKKDEVLKAIENGNKALLDRSLIFKKNTSKPIHINMMSHHYPSRWKYDYLRVLLYFALQKYPYHQHMQPALDILVKHLKYRKLTKGTTISGRIHFVLEEEKFGRFNTLNAYIVLKQYHPQLFAKLLKQDFQYSDK